MQVEPDPANPAKAAEPAAVPAPDAKAQPPKDPAAIKFDPSPSFAGYREGWIFTTRERGTGYYQDFEPANEWPVSAAEIRALEDSRKGKKRKKRKRAVVLTASDELKKIQGGQSSVFIEKVMRLSDDGPANARSRRSHGPKAPCNTCGKPIELSKESCPFCGGRGHAAAEGESPPISPTGRAAALKQSSKEHPTQPRSSAPEPARQAHSQSASHHAEASAATGTSRRDKREKEPLIGELVLVHEGKYCGKQAVVRDSSHGFYNVHVVEGDVSLLDSVECTESANLRRVQFTLSGHTISPALLAQLRLKASSEAAASPRLHPSSPTLHSASVGRSMLQHPKSAPYIAGVSVTAMANLITDTRHQCQVLRKLIARSREMPMSLEPKSGGTEHSEGINSIEDGNKGPVCAEDAQESMGGERCVRRVKVYEAAKDRWNMALCVETAQQEEGLMARVLYDKGGSQWLNLDKLNVLELCDIVWAKMGRRYPWWPAQVMREIGVDRHNQHHAIGHDTQVEFLGEHTVAWVHAKSTCGFEEGLQEYSALLESSKKVFGFSRNLVRPALEEAAALHSKVKQTKMASAAAAESAPPEAN